MSTVNYCLKGYWLTGNTFYETGFSYKRDAIARAKETMKANSAIARCEIWKNVNVSTKSGTIRRVK